MSARPGYSPITEVTRKSSRKMLAQGSLTGHSSSNLLLPQSNKISTTSSNATELTTGKPKQPKVICHSPAVVNKVANNYKLTEKITIDSPITAFITENTSRESMAATSGINAGKFGSQQKQPEEFQRPQFVGENETLLKDVVEVNQNLHSSGTKQSKNASSSLAEVTMSQNKETTRKKKLTKAVPSRYKQLSTTSKMASVRSKVSDKSKQIATTASKSLPKPTFQKSEGKRAPVNKKPDDKTSTPSSRSKTLFESDMSAIQPATIDKQAKIVGGEKAPKSVASSLNTAYSKYLCVAYLKAAMQKGSQARKIKALSDLTKLSNANVKLHKEVADLENEIKTLKFERDLDIRLDDQIENLAPVMNRLADVSHNYKEMAENVDTTRHGLPLTDIKLPSITDLEISLKKTNSLLNDVTQLSHSHSDSCCEAADNAQSLKQIVANEMEHFQDLEHNIASLKLLSIKEANLKLQLDTEKSLQAL